MRGPLILLKGTPDVEKSFDGTLINGLANRIQVVTEVSTSALLQVQGFKDVSSTMSNDCPHPAPSRAHRVDSMHSQCFGYGTWHLQATLFP